MSAKCIFKLPDPQLSFQIATAKKLLNTLSKKRGTLKIRGAVLGDGVGMGKTYTSLFTALSFMAGHLKRSQLNKQKNTSLLIVVPNNIILEKWRSEIEPYVKSNNFNDYVRALKESKTRIKEKLLAMTQSIKTFEDLREGSSRNVSWSIILLKRNQLKSLNKNTKALAALKNVIGFAIFDEAHHLKEPSIVNAFEDQVHELLTHKNAPKFLFLTATPFQKSIDQMRTIFKKPYFLNRQTFFDDLSKYIKDAQSYLQDCQNNIKDEDNLKKLKTSKKPIEQDLKTFFVINSRDTLKKVNVRKTEYINGVDLRNSKNIEKHIERSKLIFDITKLRRRWDDFQVKYLAYRFNYKARIQIEKDLTRFTSFVISKHKRTIYNLYPLKLDTLRHIIKRHFKLYQSYWNQKFIVFCDMVNDDTSRKDGRLHGALKKVVAECIPVKPSRTVNPPDLAGVLERTVKSRVFKDIFFTKIGDVHIRPEWRNRIKAAEKAFKKSKLYHLYGDDIKKYYELRFEKTIMQYACIEYLMRKICGDNEGNLESITKRKKYFKTLFGKGGVSKKLTDLPYTREVLEKMWKLYYKKSRRKGRAPEKCVQDVVSDFCDIFCEETKRIWQQWEDELPGESIAAVYNGNNRNSKVLKQYQSPLEPLALVISRVGEEGIDLQAFTRGMIHYDFDWSPGKMIQREGRVNRIGKAIEMKGRFRVFKKKSLKKHLSKENIQIHYVLMPHTYDERKYYRMRERQFLFNLLVPADLENEAFHFENKDIKGLSFKLGVKGTT